MKARKQATMRREYLRTANELQRMLLMLHTRSRAATSIQSAWRGWRQRQLFLPVWRQYQEQKAALVLQRAWRCAQAHALLPKLRAELPRLRAQRAWQKAVGLVQAAQRRQRLEAARREVAVLALQSAVRGWLVRREVSKQLAGIRRFQALWRGYKVRKTCGRASRDARRRIAAAAAAVQPQRRIGVRTREALNVLLASKQCSQVITAVAAIEFSTRYSKACCVLMVDNGGVAALLEFMRSCNRSKPHMEMLGHALACLANICRWPDLLPGVLHAPDCIIVLSERLQMFRDTEDIFMATVGILSALVRSDVGALQVAVSAPSAIKLWEGICQLLNRKMDMERRYIERLEGQKGSDVTAREATRKMVSAATQLDALEKVAARVDGIAAAHGVEVQHMQRPHQLPAGGAAAGKAGAADAAEHQEQEGLVPRSASAVVQPNLWQPKNTIVRGAFKESVATRTGMLAAVAAGVPVGQSAAGGGAAAGGLGAGVNVGGASAAGMMTKGDMFAAAGAGGDAASRRLVGPDVLLAAMQQQQQMLTQSADQECRIDQSHKQHRGR
ncbi:hypothetical protein OEZ85_014204 [Tetradesmus obliquus]|uniref:GBD/FH3 domain-containing protein n=1 Tax=Tetradesmus obliquus TaxID=3088 RepID=A0ABY8UB82_TETOB|nr:hypothetical protein OEZ85_014204 [Tetradesmus obliquus]